MCVCVCVYVCVCVHVCVNICSHIATILKNAFSSRIAHSFSKPNFLAFFLHREYSQTVKNITTAIRWEVIYLPSNGGTGNVVHHDLDLHFQDHEFVVVNISINGSRKRLDSCKIPTDFQFGVWKQDKLIFSQIFCSIPPFSGGVENTYSQFSSKLFD